MKTLLTILTASILLFSCSSEPKMDASGSDQKEQNTQANQKDTIKILNEQIKNDPNNPDLYIAKSSVYQKRKQFGEALDEAKRAVKADSTAPRTWVHLSKLYYDSKRIKESMQTVNNALDLDPDYSDAHIRMAWIYLILQDYEKVYEHANSALKTNEFLAEPYYIKGLAYKEQGNFKLAISSFRTATEQDNDHYDAWIQLGLLHAKAQHPLTVSYYDNAIRVDSTNYEAHYNKGFYLQNQGKYREAMEEYDAILRHNESFYNAHFNKGFIYLEHLEKYDSAAMMYTNVININPMNYKAYLNRALAKERDGQLTAALADVNEALNLKPDFELAARAKSRIEGKMERK